MSEDDDAVLAEMKLQTENPQKAKVAAPQYAKSKWTEKSLKKHADQQGMVAVKCVSTRQPWANEMPLKFWEDYRVPIKDAIILDERRFAVILHPFD